jgi:hypothetical protein
MLPENALISPERIVACPLQKHSLGLHTNTLLSAHQITNGRLVQDFAEDDGALGRVAALFCNAAFLGTLDAPIRLEVALPEGVAVLRSMI